MGAASASKSLGQETFPASPGSEPGSYLGSHACWTLRGGRLVYRCPLNPLLAKVESSIFNCPRRHPHQLWGCSFKSPGLGATIQAQPSLNPKAGWKSSPAFNPEPGCRGPWWNIGSQSQPLIQPLSEEEAGGRASAARASQLGALEPDVTLTLNGKSSLE